MCVAQLICDSSERGGRFYRSHVRANEPGLNYLGRMESLFSGEMARKLGNTLNEYKLAETKDGYFICDVVLQCEVSFSFILQQNNHRLLG